MQRSAWKFIAVLTLLALAANSATPADEGDQQQPGKKYLLRYRLAAEELLEYTVESDSTIHVQVGDAADIVRHTSVSGKVYRVVSVDEAGVAELEVTIKYVQMTAKNHAKNIEWDSRTKEPPPDSFKGVLDTIGSPLGTVKVSPTGEIVSVALRDGAGKEAGVSQWEVFPMLPEEPVAVGDTWKEPFEIQVYITPKLKKDVSMQRMYALRSVENGRATIDVRTIVLSPVRDPKEEGQLIQRTPSGTLVLDLEKGRLIERDLKIDNRVVGFQGPQTSLEVVGVRRESLAAAEEKVASGDETDGRPVTR